MDVRRSLQKIFGFEDFRPGQQDAIAAALEDRDSLVVMPTGSGKSLCYQLPALMRDDLTIVVSPLVSLMQDQVQALSAVVPGAALLVNAQRGGALNAETVARAARGEVRLLYVAPERFASRGFEAALSQARVGLFVVDEAHCVSQWGHDFRPDYFSLAAAARRLGARATIALTATATPTVAQDICRRLELRHPVRITTGFDRPNLSFAVVPCATAIDKQRRIAAALSADGALPAIVYAGTRKMAEELARSLGQSLQEDVLVYHAGLDRARRAATQERFMSGEARVIVATNAFGMGIDRADVRTVCHATVPGSLEAYYQEAGRAGRDGRPARCLLFAEKRDKGLHVFFIERARVADGVFEAVAERLRWAGIDGHYDVDLGDLGAVLGPRAHVDAVRAVVGHLARAGMLTPEPSTPDRAAGRIAAEWDRRMLGLCLSSARDAERARWAQYRSIWEYVEHSSCRREALLRHFGDSSRPAPSVACCDVCAPHDAAPPEPAATAVRSSAPAAPAVGLDQAIIEIVGSARPAVGRTRAVEILRGGRSKVIAQYAYDQLSLYGAFAHVRSADVLGRVDQLLQAGTLRSTGGRFPKLRVVAVVSPGARAV